MKCLLSVGAPGRTLHLLALLTFGTGSVLIGGEAKATLYNACLTEGSENPFSIFFNDLNQGDQFQCQDKLFTIGDPADLKATNDPAQSLSGGFLSFQWTQLAPADAFYSNDTFGISIYFRPNLTTPASGAFEYTLDVTDPSFSLRDVSLDTVVDHDEETLASTVVNKDVFAYDSPTAFASLSSVDGAPNIPRKVSMQNLTSIRVVDSWSVATGDTLDTIKNTFRQNYEAIPPEEEVPGPVPLLGAAAAFGLSRRLRRRCRIQQAG